MPISITAPPNTTEKVSFSCKKAIPVNVDIKGPKNKKFAISPALSPIESAFPQQIYATKLAIKDSKKTIKK